MCAALTSRHVKSLSQRVVHRLPVHASAFHRDVGHRMRRQPIAPHHQVPRRRAEALHVLLRALAGAPANPHAGRDGVLMHVESTAALDLSLLSRFCSACSQQQCGMPKAPTSHSMPDSLVPSSGDVARSAATRS
jgi:hypothetical protein